MPDSTPATAGVILVVDDVRDNRLLLCRRLARAGHQIIEAENGVQALAALARHPIDIVLLDILMPEMDGYEVLARMRADPELARVPVIMISAVDEEESVVRCISLGAEDYLPKPFSPALLEARVQASMEKKRLRDREREKTFELEETLSRLRVTQDQLILQDRLASLGALAAGVAHEMKNPLNFICNFARVSKGLLQELKELSPGWQNKDGEETFALLDANLERIQEHGRRADAIVKGMLLHARESGGERRRTDLNSLVAEFANYAIQSVEMTTGVLVTLEQSLDKGVGEVDLAPQDISRVIVNIVGNGAEAAIEKQRRLGGDYKPVVSIETKRANDIVEIKISDNGTGMPAGVIDRIFEPFFTTKPPGAGTGLGLSISHDIIVNGHQGELLATSEQGKGSEFVIRLPAIDERE